LTPLAKEALQQYPWPGGLRELYSVLEGAVLQSSGAVITPDLLPAQLHMVNDGRQAPANVPPPYPQRFDAGRFNAGNQVRDVYPPPARQPRAAVRALDIEAPQSADAASASVMGWSTEEAAGEEIPLFSPGEPLSAENNLPSFPVPSVRIMRHRYGELEKRMIVDMLTLHDNDVAAAAKELRMRESSLRKRLAMYSIEISDSMI